MPHPDQVSTDNLRGVARQLGGWLDQSVAAKFRAAGPGATPPPGAPFNFPDPSAPVAAAASPGSAGPDYAGPDPAFEPPPAFELGESFALYSLGAEAIERGLLHGADLARLAGSCRRWHHQIKVDKKPVGFARSACEGEADFEVRQIYRSELARCVDEGITWLDDYEQKNPNGEGADPVVRLLIVPAYQVHAFWLCQPGAEGEPCADAPPAASQGKPGGRRHVGPSRVLVIDAPPHLSGLRLNALLTSTEFLEAFRDQKPSVGGLIFPEGDSEDDDSDDESGE